MENPLENLSGKSSGKIGDGKSERKTWKIRDAWKIYMENLLMTGKFGKLEIKQLFYAENLH